MNFQTHTISWNLTRRCNLQCEHCYLDADFRAGHKIDELVTAECFDTIEQIAEINPNALLILTGGEPLLRPDIFQIIKYAAERDFFVVLATNGTTINRSNARQLADAGVKGISISLHSSHPAHHDRFTGVSGSWQAVLNCAHTLAEIEMDFVIQTSLASWNYEEIPAIANMSYEMGARFFNLYSLVCTGRGQGLTDISPELYEDSLTRLYEIQKQYLGRMLISAKCTPQYKRIIYAANPNSPLLKSYAGGCPAATHYCQINPQGEVTPCPYMPIPVGNVRESSFADIWRNSTVLNELRDRSLLEGRCGICEFKSLCSGCRARAFADSQNYQAEDPSCTYQPGAMSSEEIVLAEQETLGTKLEYKIPWEEDARDRLSNIPTFARGMVVKGVEHFAWENQFPVVTVEVMKKARENIAAGRGSMVPFSNVPNPN